ncbi:TRAP transporter small permease subunit [Acuticoccus yangtzensis]|uniref:TRAP transporter small permease subunit n=1 Tax=Acuticoccus yangtzensis TaxID=1443441 RepID=UPI00094989CD|nr:TRAP transporter small permease [Acuticoccus yangtzensis]ORE92453.1 TRAP dicarboxylate transporter subunit DctQ [Stappia sp. 22II-S9-Z10]
MYEVKPKSPIDYISLAISRVGLFLVAVIVGIMFYEVVMRYFFERPTLWVNEMSLWIGGFIYLLAGLYVLQQRGHIRITLLYDAVPRWVQRVFDVISTICICIFAAMVIHGGMTEAVQKYGRWETFGTAWDPPIPATMKPAILIISALIILQSIANLIADWNETPLPEGVVEDDVIEELKGSYRQTVSDRHD